MKIAVLATFRTVGTVSGGRILAKTVINRAVPVAQPPARTSSASMIR
jgi:hypothetical protein